MQNRQPTLSFLLSAFCLLSLATADWALAQTTPATPFRSRRTEDDPKGPAIIIPRSQLTALREKVARTKPAASPLPAGWSKRSTDWPRVMAIFAPLRLRRGYVLRAYQYNTLDAGASFVWAMPETADFPEPNDCPRWQEHPLHPPRPSSALEVMEAIEGDGSPWSYACASILKRELEEYGARERGCDWLLHRLLDQNPWKTDLVVENLSPIEGPTGKADRWTWLAREPQQWSPHVRTTMDRVQVFFCSYCGLGKQTIYRQTDTYRRGAYRFTTERTAIVEGPKGFVHPELIQKSRSSR